MKSSTRRCCVVFFVVALGVSGLLGSGCAVDPNAPCQCGATLSSKYAKQRLDRMLTGVSAIRVKQDVETLASFGTRHTFSETESDTRGIGAARRWIKGQFEDATRLSGRTGDAAMRVYFDSHHVEPDGRRILEPVEVVNVIAELPGTDPIARKRYYYIAGHYDSRGSDPLDGESDAPGANDDASGVAVALELARVMSQFEWDSTIVFMATCAEEQGLIGARKHAQAMRENGRDIRAVFGVDIAGDPAGEHAKNSPEARASRKTIRVFSQGIPRGAEESMYQGISREGTESDSEARQLARYISEIAIQHDLAVKPTLIFRNDRFMRGGDHSAFLEAGYPAAVRFTVLHEDYTKQHQDVRVETDDEGNKVQYGDLPEYVEAEYLGNVTRLNGAALAHLANAPSSPPNARIIVAELTTSTTLRWDKSPESDVWNYEIVWRETTSPVWQHSKDVGNVTEGTIDLSKDNWLFGVRAVDREGFKSPVSYPRAARE